MRANLDIENRNILTKKFWSYLKSTTKSTRIPEVVSSSVVSRSPLYKSFFHTVIHEWNSLPLHIRVTPDTPNFKNKVTNHFWSVLHNNSNNPI